MEVKDPVCNMSIEEKDAIGTSVHEGTTYYFCSTNCKEKFDKDAAMSFSSVSVVGNALRLRRARL